MKVWQQGSIILKKKTMQAKKYPSEFEIPQTPEWNVLETSTEKLSI